MRNGDLVWMRRAAPLLSGLEAAMHRKRHGPTWLHRQAGAVLVWWLLWRMELHRWLWVRGVEL